jgi:hypothetical protein
LRSSRYFSAELTTLVFLLSSASAPKALAFDGSERAPVVVELFTSQGCSSCPPADRLLKTLSQSFKAGPEVVVVSEHVDYWDHLGWKDPFSSRLFTERQYAYARAFGQSGVYTPEMVVNGATGFVGTDSNRAFRAITDRSSEPSSKIPLSVERKPGKDELLIRVSNSHVELSNDEQLVIFLTQGSSSTQVKAGENSGQVLTHTGVARFVKAFKATSSEPLVIKVPPETQLASLRVVAIRQNTKDMRITGSGVAMVLQ